MKTRLYYQYRLIGQLLRYPRLFALLFPIVSANINRFIAEQLQLNQENPLIQFPRKLLVDVSIIAQKDSRTGIQRCVRSLLVQLIQNPPQGYCISPVAATRKKAYRHVTLNLNNNGVTCVETGSLVKIGVGDIFLGLDLAALQIANHFTQLMQWKTQGASLHFMIYDLLPLLYPGWFKKKTQHNFHRWMYAITLLADSFLCSTNVVREEIRSYLARWSGLKLNDIPITVISQGSDINSSLPSVGIEFKMQSFLSSLYQKKVILMVGTVEPRKGYQQVLDAFTQLWRNQQDIILLIIGKPGWKTQQLQRQLSCHPERDKHLFWLVNVTDEMLHHCYNLSQGVILASEAEGFGLPLIEALAHTKPVLARDIPVFREISAGNGLVSYFKTRDPTLLMDEILRWLEHINNQSLWDNHDKATLPTWELVGSRLLDALHPYFLNYEGD